MLLFKESWTRSAPSFRYNWRSPQRKLWLLPEILLGSEMPPAAYSDGPSVVRS